MFRDVEIYVSKFLQFSLDNIDHKVSRLGTYITNFSADYMPRKVAFWLVWIGFIVYAFFLAPPDSPDTFKLIENLSTGHWQGINPLIVALFNVMGILPMIYGCFMFIDGINQKIPAWLFVSASFAVGAFALLPYLALRSPLSGISQAPNQKISYQNNTLVKICDSHITGVVLTLVTVSLITYAFSAGEWSDFFQQWKSSRFIHVMSLDFCVLSLSIGALLGDDMARRGIKKSWIFWLTTLVPLFGPLIYLCWRPPLRINHTKAVEITL